MTRKTPAPDHLEPATKRWWDSVLSDYSLDPHHLRLLQLAAECWDRSQEARIILQLDGLTVNGKDGLKPHPMIKVHADATITFARLIRELDLDVEPPPDNRTGPPALKSNRRL